MASFTAAEDYHQKYALRRHRDVVRSLLLLDPDDPLLVKSTAAARLNAFFDGSLTRSALDAELRELGLDSQGTKTVEAVVRLPDETR